MSEIEVSLSLIGREYDLEYVNKTLGIEPDYARRHEGEKDRLPEPQLSELTERLRKIQDLEPDLGWSLDNILLGTTEWD